jgi:hypothetical protein
MPTNSAWRLIGSAWSRSIQSLCARQAGLVERACQKIILQRELADLGVQVPQVQRRRSGRFGPKHAGCAIEQLVLPVVDLVGMHVVHLGQFGQRLVASYRVHGHLGLEDR